MAQPTRDIAAWIAASDAKRYRREVLLRAQHAVLDWIGVTLAGSRDPLVGILTEDAIGNGEAGPASLIGRRETVSPASAALINGAASHALDFDDVNSRLRGHPSVTVLPAVWTLAEQHHRDGRALLDAFIVGYEVACCVGEMMAPSHYENGWHSTATVGTLGAAAGAARMLGLQVDQCAHALGAAATQAAGLKAMFGTMCKPLHAGKAATNGLLAARWAALGLTSSDAVIETHQGFAYTQSTSFSDVSLPDDAQQTFAVESGLYKYHAACYLTHASIEAVKTIAADQGLSPRDIKQVNLHVLATLLDVCDIVAPASGLEIKFSIRHLVAMALSGIDTAELSVYSKQNAERADLIALRDRIAVVPDNLPTRTSATVVIETFAGDRFERTYEAGTPLADTAVQWEKLAAKFLRLTAPILGQAAAEEIVLRIARLEDETDMAQLARRLRT